MNKLKILSINGGGIKGIYTLYFLFALEEKFCKEGDVLADYFDLICATSTGALITLCLTLRMKVKNIIDIYEKNANLIFPDNNHNWITKSFYKILRSVYQIDGCKYDINALTKLCDELLKDKTTDDINNAICIPSYCVLTNKNIVFKSNNTQVPYKLSEIVLDTLNSKA